MPDGSILPLPPILLGTSGNDPKKKTVCIYEHLDVQPAALVCFPSNIFSNCIFIYNCTHCSYLSHNCYILLTECVEWLQCKLLTVFVLCFMIWHISILPCSS